jgi:glycosyltransferase involved in cell wall biosynthesis
VNRPTLSVVIIAQNEQRTIGDVLAAVKPLAQEIILVDSGSSDRTIEIAQSYGAQVRHQEWLGYAGQKNFALSLAGGDWILSLDADEILTPPLVAEIEQVLQQKSSEYAGYKIPRILYIGDIAVKHGGFYPDAQLRLFERGKGKFRDRMVHEAVILDGKAAQLREAMKHMAYADVAGFQVAMEKYARLSTQESLRNGYRSWKISWLNLWLHPGWTFFMRYFIRGGFMDGRLGLELSLIYSDYVRRKIKYLREAVAGKSC